jgi:hypothetical protein
MVNIDATSVAQGSGEEQASTIRQRLGPSVYVTSHNSLNDCTALSLPIFAGLSISGSGLKSKLIKGFCCISLGVGRAIEYIRIREELPPLAV